MKFGIFYEHQYPPLADDAIPDVLAYGLSVAETDDANLDAGTRQRRKHLRRIAVVANRR